MKNLTWCSLLLLSLTFACKKTDDNKPNDNTPKTGTCYLQKAYDEESAVIVKYNSAMRPEGMDWIVNGETLEAFKFKYNSAGQMTGYDYVEENIKIYEVTFFYNPDSTINKIVGGEDENTIEYIYNDNKQIIRTNEYRENSSTDISDYELYTYNANGNITIIERYFSSGMGEEPQFSGSVECEYDSYKNPMLALNLPFIFNDDVTDISKNNLTKRTHKDKDGNITGSTQFTYNYNAQGYPITDKAIYDDGDTYTMQLEYNCK